MCPLEKKLKPLSCAIFLIFDACSTAPLKSEFHSQWAEVHFLEGIKALQERDTKKAIRELEGCVKSDSRRVDCHWELGWAYYRESLWKLTLEQWNWVASQPSPPAELAEMLPRVQELARFHERIVEENRRAKTTLSPHVLLAEQKRIKIKAVGDVMMGSTFPAPGILPPKDGMTLFSAVKENLRDADLTFANLEGPICDKGRTKKCKGSENCYVFKTPTKFTKNLADIGIDLASLANNHANDFEEPCRFETEKSLNRFGIKWSGRPSTFASIEKQGLRVGMVAFYTSPHSNYLNDTEAAAALISQVKRHHDLVMVSFHGGAEGLDALHVPEGSEEFYGEDRGSVRVFAKAAIDAGADIVIGHGPHVLRAMEVYRDRLIAYSLGNFATYGRFNISSYQGVGMILEATLDGAGRFLQGRIHSTRQVGKGIPEPDPEQQAVDLVRALSQEDFPSTSPEIAKDGTFVAKE